MIFFVFIFFVFSVFCARAMDKPESIAIIKNIDLVISIDDEGVKKFYQKYLSDRVAQVERGEADPSILNKLPHEHKRGLLRTGNLDLKLFEKILELGADPNFDDGYATPLSNHASQPKIELLLKYGADPKKCKKSCLSNVVMHYLSGEKYYRKEKSKQEWYGEAFRTMNLLLEKGEDIHKQGEVGHLLYSLASMSIADDEDRKLFLSFLIRNGSNPKLPWCSIYFPNPLSVYDRLKEYDRLNKDYNYKYWVSFIQEERYKLVRPLLLATAIERKENKLGITEICYKQPEECHMRSLPKPLVEKIGKIVWGWEEEVKS